MWLWSGQWTSAPILLFSLNPGKLQITLILLQPESPPQWIQLWICVLKHRSVSLETTDLLYWWPVNLWNLSECNYLSLQNNFSQLILIGGWLYIYRSLSFVSSSSKLKLIKIHDELVNIWQLMFDFPLRGAVAKILPVGVSDNNNLLCQ